MSGAPQWWPLLLVSTENHPKRGTTTHSTDTSLIKQQLECTTSTILGFPKSFVFLKGGPPPPAAPKKWRPNFASLRSLTPEPKRRHRSEKKLPQLSPCWAPLGCTCEIDGTVQKGSQFFSALGKKGALFGAWTHFSVGPPNKKVGQRIGATELPGKKQGSGCIHLNIATCLFGGFPTLFWGGKSHMFQMVAT